MPLRADAAEGGIPQTMKAIRYDPASKKALVDCAKKIQESGPLEESKGDYTDEQMKKDHLEALEKAEREGAFLGGGPRLAVRDCDIAPWNWTAKTPSDPVVLYWTDQDLVVAFFVSSTNVAGAVIDIDKNQGLS